ncbi:MAG: M3 family oligoendopeptidase [Flavobacteriales bacterium]|nr:M3 family oligoendopeptidase [Flavobacteriales bacterium]
MRTLEPARRNFLPETLVVSDWGSIAPYFRTLADREVDSAVELESWLRDLSELEAVLSEEGGWRYIRMSVDTRDKEAGSRYESFVMDVLPEVEKWTDRLQRKLMDIPYVENLKGEGYPVYFRGIREQLRIFREANVPIQAELRAMAQEYGVIIGAMSVEWKGEVITLPKAASILESPDREERQAIFERIAMRRALDREKLDGLFDRMIAKRKVVAVNAGFADFRDYMYSALGRFDHGPSDALAFHKSVEKDVVPVVDRLHTERKERLGLDGLRPWDLSVDPSGKPPLRPFRDVAELVVQTRKVFNELDPWFAECLSTMQTMGRLDLDSRDGKAPGGYNYPLHESGPPFIFMNAVGTTDDVITMVHEGGHAVHSFLTHSLPITGFKNFPSEVAELASMSMELLTMDHWHLIYPDPVDLKRAKREQLERVLTVLPWVATIDAFQHAVYTHPEWTMAERTEEWARTHRRFGGSVVDWSDLELERSMLWQKQLHLFEVPFYYIEYGIAQLGAIAVWRNYKRDPKKAVQQYKTALSLGYTRPLPEIYEAAGIRFDLSSNYVRELIGFVNDELDAV